MCSARIEKRRKRFSLELAEFRIIRSNNQIFNKQAKKKQMIQKRRGAVEKKDYKYSCNFVNIQLNNDIRFYKEKTAALHNRAAAARKRQHTSKTKFLAIVSNVQASQFVPCKRVHRVSWSEASSAAEGAPVGKRRSISISLPVIHIPQTVVMKELSEGLHGLKAPRLRQPLSMVNAFGKGPVSAFAPNKTLPFPMVASIGTDNGFMGQDIDDDFGIPECVIKRGRRPSRLASCMSDLVRQEISDDVDKKNEHLPSISAPENQRIQYTTNSSSFDNSNKKHGRVVSHRALDESGTMEQSIDALQAKTHRLSLDSTISGSSSISDDKSTPSSLPVPPDTPKPPNSPRTGGHPVRRHRGAAKISL